MFRVVVPDIGDADAHFVRRILVEVTQVFAPNRVRERGGAGGAEDIATVEFESMDHILPPQPMFADQQMHVIPQNREGVTREPLTPHDFSDRVRQDLSLGVRRPERFVQQQRFRFSIKSPQSFLRRTVRYPPMMNLPQRGNLLRSELVRHTPSRVIGQPVSVPRQNQMLRDQHSRPHCSPSHLPHLLISPERLRR